MKEGRTELIKEGRNHLIHQIMPIIITPAYLWDGNKQLAGILSLTPKNLIFEFKDFQKSHLKLQISLQEIKKAETILIYEITKKGLKVTGRKEQTDLFVLDDPITFRKELLKAMNKLRV